MVPHKAQTDGAVAIMTRTTETPQPATVVVGTAEHIQVVSQIPIDTAELAVVVIRTLTLTEMA